MKIYARHTIGESYQPIISLSGVLDFTNPFRFRRLSNVITNVIVLTTIVFSGVILTGCSTNTPYDYSNYLRNMPRSIVILPPLNETTEVNATYSYLSTVTQPIAEQGYYVFPVAVVDAMMKENGMPSAGEMHQIPAQKFREILGADAVLYAKIKYWGTHFHVVESSTGVGIEAELVDTATGLMLWQGAGELTEDSNSGAGNNLLGMIVGAVVSQVANNKSNRARAIAKQLNPTIYQSRENGLLPGYRSPRFQSATGSVQ